MFSQEPAPTRRQANTLHKFLAIKAGAAALLRPPTIRYRPPMLRAEMAKFSMKGRHSALLHTICQAVFDYFNDITASALSIEAAFGGGESVLHTMSLSEEERAAIISQYAACPAVQAELRRQAQAKCQVNAEAEAHTKASHEAKRRRKRAMTSSPRWKSSSMWRMWTYF